MINLNQNFQWALQRNITVILIFAALSQFFVNYDRLTVGTKVRSKQFLDPSSYGRLIKFMEDEQVSGPGALKEYLFYYEEFKEHAGPAPDVYGMLGYCYYHLGEYQKAAEHYRDAIKMHPKVFWSYYNLAGMYFKIGKYEEAVRLLQAATVLDPYSTLEFISKSRGVFRPIMLGMGLDYGALRERMKEGYRNSYRMLVLSNYHLKDYEEMRKSADFARIAKVGDEGLFLYYSGLASYHLKDFPQAVTFLQESIRLDPEHANSQYYLSLSFEALGMKELAVQSKRKIENIPDNMPYPEVFPFKPEVF